MNTLKLQNKTLTSLEVAEMVEKNHNELLKDIRRYITQLGEGKISHTDFFLESSYKSAQNKELPCYLITKKGCEFIANKLTGKKGQYSQLHILIGLMKWKSKSLNLNQQWRF